MPFSGWVSRSPSCLKLLSRAALCMELYVRERQWKQRDLVP